LSIYTCISSSLGASSSLEDPKQDTPLSGGGCPENFDPIFDGDDPVEPDPMSPAELEDFLSLNDFRSLVRA
jgi:hypothetical protein